MIYEITSEGPTFGPARHCVNLGTRETGRSVCAVHVEAGGPKPVAVRRVDTGRVEVEFKAPLADGARVLVIALAAGQLPVEATIVDPKGGGCGGKPLNDARPEPPAPERPTRKKSPAIP